MHAHGDDRAAAWQPIFTPGDLVWYQHPSGPWIAGRVAGVEMRSKLPLYAIVTIEDGVRRLSQESELRLRTSGHQGPPAGTVFRVSCRPSFHQAALRAVLNFILD